MPSSVRPTTRCARDSDGSDAQLVAAARREGQPVALDPVAGVGPEDDVRR